MISSKQIQIFYEIYKKGSVTSAAKELHISQPAVSKTLAIIEKNLGFKLFIRKGKKLTPTIEADELFEHASIVNSQLKNFNNIANTYKSRSADFINIGTTPSLAQTIIPEILRNYKDTDKDARFSLVNLNSIDLIEERYKPDIDVTICFNAKDQKNMNTLLIKKGIHKIVSPKSFNIPPFVNLSDIANYPFIEITNLLSLYSEYSVMNYFMNNNLEVKFSGRSDSYIAALSMIEGGLGLSILDDNTCERANLETVNISNINDPTFEYEINAFIRNDNVRKESLEFFKSLV
tara:strand:- start:26 stop:895 length:870 start_codon:yes stop_codon:yes gene_type:complete